MGDSRLLRKYRGEQCLNCEQPLDISDKYCPNCGQLNTKKKLSISDIINEFFASIISYDSRLRNTLGALLFKPGKISKEYISGRRQRYTNPFRFYLSVSFIFFILYGLTTNFDELDSTFTTQDSGIGYNYNFSDAVAEDEFQLKDLDSIIKASKAQDSLKTYKDLYFTEEELDNESFYSSTDKRLELYGQFYEDTQILGSKTALDSLKHTNTWYHRYLYGKSIQISNIGQNISSLISYFINKLPFIIFFYLPVFALFIWLLYIRHPFNYMEHLIFVFHLQSLCFVLYSIALILNIVGVPEVIYSITSLIFLFYLYKALRKFYAQGRFKTIVKFILINFVFLILAGIGVILAFIVSFATY